MVTRPIITDRVLRPKECIDGALHATRAGTWLPAPCSPQGIGGGGRRPAGRLRWLSSDEDDMLPLSDNEGEPPPLSSDFP